MLSLCVVANIYKDKHAFFYILCPKFDTISSLLLICTHSCSYWPLFVNRAYTMCSTFLHSNGSTLVFCFSLFCLSFCFIISPLFRIKLSELYTLTRACATAAAAVTMLCEITIITKSLSPPYGTLRYLGKRI